MGPATTPVHKEKKEHRGPDGQAGGQRMAQETPPARREIRTARNTETATAPCQQAAIAWRRNGRASPCPDAPRPAATSHRLLIMLLIGVHAHVALEAALRIRGGFFCPGKV